MNKRRLLLPIIFLLLIILGLGILFSSMEKDVTLDSEMAKDSFRESDNEKDDKDINDSDREEDSKMLYQINININGTNYEATLEDNPTTQELFNRLPLEITMNELNGNEKYYYFDESLPTNASTVGKINSGDIMLYQNNCLVIFYDTFNTIYSYTKIGSINNPSSLKENIGSKDVKVVITKKTFAK